MEKGTLFQLKVLINRTAVKSIPSQNMKATEDFLLLILHAYVIVAAEQCKRDVDTCISLSKRIIKKFVKISLPGEEPTNAPDDDVFNYATDLLSFCLLWHGFHDAIREGDGDRILTYWKFFTAIFQQQGHYNYAKEGLLLTMQSQLLSKRKVAELKWSRIINVSVQRGHNIPCDLHMEHLNRRLKRMMTNVGANKSQKPFTRLAKSLGVVSHICSNFATESGVSECRPHHTYPSFTKDLETITQKLRSQGIFCVDNNRGLSFFNRQPILKSVKWKNVGQWTKNKIIEFDFNEL